MVTYVSLKEPIILASDQKILDVLQDYEAHNRKWICEQTGMKRTTVYDCLRRLIQMELVEEWSVRNGLGRPKTVFCLILEDDKL